MAEDNGRISVSRDALRADLAQMELRLIQTLATKDEVGDLSAKIGALDIRVGTLERREGDEDAVKRQRESLFTVREKRWGMIVATAAVLVQVLVLTGVIR